MPNFSRSPRIDLTDITGIKVSTALRRFFTCTAGLLFCTGLHAQLTQIEADDIAFLQRSLQAEAILRTTSSYEVDVCVDQAINGVWLLDDGSRSPPSHLVDRLRRASEACNDQQRFDKERLATQISRTVQRQARSAIQLEQMKTAARGCVDTSRDELAFRACIASTLGENSVKIGWVRWQSLYRSKRN